MARLPSSESVEESIAKYLVNKLQGAAVEAMSSNGSIILTIFDDHAVEVFEYLANNEDQILLDRYERDSDNVRGYFYLIVLPKEKAFTNLKYTQFDENVFAAICLALQKKNTQAIQFKAVRV